MQRAEELRSAIVTPVVIFTLEQSCTVLLAYNKYILILFKTTMSESTTSTLTQTPTGNLTLSIPWTIANALNITPGTELQFQIVDGNILLKPQTHPEYTLDELLEGITPETIHSEIDWGNPIGNEHW
jgi:antitoxin MazE